MTVRARRFVGPAIALAVVVAGLAYAFWPLAVPVDIAAVTRGALSVTVDGDGQTRVREVYVVSAPVAGRVLRIERHVGDAVAAGETVLATIEPGDPAFLDRRGRRQAEAAVEAAAAAKMLGQAELASGLAELEFARSDLDRASRLAERGTISERALDSAKLEYHRRDAALAAARAALDMRAHELETAQAALIEPGEDGGGESENCCVEVKAPVSGRVLALVQESEAVVAAGAPLVEIGDPRDLEIVVDLLSSDAVKVAKGAEVRIEGWGGDGALEGRVRRVEPTGFTKVSALGIEEQRVNVIIDFTGAPESRQALGHGYRVEARVVIWRADDVLKIPTSALFREGDSWAVFVEEDGRAARRLVEIGHGNGREAEVLDGLADGEQVVMHPSDRVDPGTRIAPRPKG